MEWNKYLDRKRNPCQINSIIKDDVEITDPNEISNEFKRYFAATKLSSEA